MKNLIIAVLLITVFCGHNQLRAQTKSEAYLTRKQLVGIWVMGSPDAGNGIDQNFVFTNDGHFTFNNGKAGDDLVSTLQLNGNYRLNRDKLFFTIVSRVLIENADIGVVGSTVDFGIFEYRGGKTKLIKEKNPKEIEDPAEIMVIKPNHIKINDEDYYKIASNPKDISKYK